MTGLKAVFLGAVSAVPVLPVGVEFGPDPFTKSPAAPPAPVVLLLTPWL